jgi:hypothetical protein
MAVYENSAPINATTSNFISAAKLTNKTHLSAISYLSSNLISTGLYDKLVAIYPMVGGTSGSHMYNLKNPVDSNAAYRLSFFAGVTHNSTGSIFDGGSGYANTFLSASSTDLSQNSVSLWYYATGGKTSNFPANVLGTNNIGINTPFSIYGNNYSKVNDNFDGGATPLNNSFTKGFIGVSRTGSASFNYYIDGNVFYTANATSITPTTNNLFIGAENVNGTPQFHTTLSCGFAAIGKGLTTTESFTLNTIVKQYETILGRQ